MKITFDAELLLVSDGNISQVRKVLEGRTFQELIEKNHGRVFAIVNPGNARAALSELGEFISDEKYAAMPSPMDFY